MPKDETAPEIHARLKVQALTLERCIRAASLKIGKIRPGISDTATMVEIENILMKLTKSCEAAATLQSGVDALYKKAITDGLTQVLNRAYFEEVIKPEIQSIPKSVVLLADVDHFGRYNNRYGHQQGDVALQTIARIIRIVVGSDSVARYGGEEFAGFITKVRGSASLARKFAEHIRETVDSTLIPCFSAEALAKSATSDLAVRGSTVRLLECAATVAEYRNLLRQTFPCDRRLQKYLLGLRHITCSIGVAVRRAREPANHLIYRVDQALYVAKAEGRNRVVLNT